MRSETVPVEEARDNDKCRLFVDNRQAQLCVLSAGCNEPADTKLVEALCAEQGLDESQVYMWVE